MRVITASEVERLLPIHACIPIMRQAMVATSHRHVTLPMRQFMPVPDSSGKMAIMPGALGDPACFGIKLVCKYQRPPGDPLGSHVGMVLLFDSTRGVPLAMIEGSTLTAIRTSAASALATDLLARKDARRLAVLGTGEQARRHIQAMRSVRTIEHIGIWGRDRKRAAQFASEAKAATGIVVEQYDTAVAAVEGADIICTTTAAHDPVLPGTALQAGQHLNLVGSAVAAYSEVDSETVQRGRFFVDYRDAAMAAAGELLKAIDAGVVTAGHIAGEIGDVATGAVAGRISDADVTIYKSLGVASQDLAAAHAVWRAAEAEGTGLKVDLLE
ncbi:MAG: ornithine cyclodeaminase family protein [Sphingomonadaceae bacterium]|nr:ornithine cyclodeaminase family protein [Sphingomonadaceae bacterium]